MQEQMQHRAETGMERGGGPKHVHAARDGLAVGHVVQQRLGNGDELQLLLGHRPEAEHVAHRPDVLVKGVDFDNMVQLRADVQHHLIHAQ
jgi:hypothetical protein